MINLNKINISFFCSNILFIFFLINTVSFEAKGIENKIIFKINNNVFTTLDLQMRMKYLDFVGSNSDLNEGIIIDDFISVNLFFEYYNNLNKKNNFDNKIEEIFINIIKANQENNRKFNYEIDREIILSNIKLDYIRKFILENILNSNINEFKTSKKEIDLLYNLKIKYINLNSNNNEIIKKIISLDNNNFNEVIKLLNQNNISYFIKEKEINNIEKVNKKIKENILLGKEYFVLKKQDKISLIFIEKKFETLEGISVDLYSVRSKDKLNNDLLKCNNLFENVNNLNIINKKYVFKELNDELKKNLIDINDYVKFYNNDENVYVVLCDIIFDINLLNNMNFNKLINNNALKFEKKFINKYSKIYKLIKIND